MKLKDGKSKVITFSYDDGGVQDKKLVDIFNKYGLKCTFNISTGLYMPEDMEREGSGGRLKLSEAQELYMGSGHEVAVHTYKHTFLEQLKDDEILDEVLKDRKNIEAQFKTFARGMAYPFGSYDDRVIRLLKSAGICYSRTTVSTKDFKLPKEWLALHPTCHHNDPDLMVLAERFINENPKWKNHNFMFYVWGHSYEFDNNNNWDLIPKLAEHVANRDDIWYATNIEIYDYVNAYKSLITSVDKKIVYNPTATDVWFMEEGEIYCVHGGETIQL